MLGAVSDERGRRGQPGGGPVPGEETPHPPRRRRAALGHQRRVGRVRAALPAAQGRPRRTPYGTPASTNTPAPSRRFLRVDPAQLGRLEEMTANAEARLAEARDNVWLGE